MLAGLGGGQNGQHCESKGFGESRAERILQEITFISRNRTVNGLFCLNPRPIQQSHELFYKPNKWDTMDGYLPQWLVDKCTNKNISGWSSFPTLTPDVTGFCSRNRQIYNLISKPSLLNLHSGFP